MANEEENTSILSMSLSNLNIAQQEEANHTLALYKIQIKQGDIQKSYHYLMRYMMHLKAYFSRHLPDTFSMGNISPGYLDFTYFPFFDDFLRERKLRLGIVLNHQSLQFELWLMGQNALVQQDYWELLKTSQWNRKRTEMPKYSILEDILITDIRFNQIDKMTAEIFQEALKTTTKITDEIKKREVS
jgi:hypothetical protein